MGYTHYWTQKSRFTKAEWNDVGADLTAILETAAADGLVLAENMGEHTLASVRDALVGDTFAFNGIGVDAHETFYIQQDRAPLESWQAPSDRGRGFCKTARKPYDVAVTACLVYLESAYPERFSVSSDGTSDDWEAGLTLARAALPRLDNVLNIPAEIRFDSLFSRFHFSGGRHGLATTLAGDLCLVDRTAFAILGRFTSAESVEWVTTWAERVEAERQRNMPTRLDVLQRWHTRKMRTFKEAAETFGYLTPEKELA